MAYECDGLARLTSNQLDGVRLPGGLLSIRSATKYGTVRQRWSGSFQERVTVGSNPARATRRSMMNDKNQFTIQLSNGKEQSFDSANQMTEWLDRQRGLRYSGKARTVGNGSKRSGGKQRPKERSPEENSLPLARYANRHSGEA